MFVNGFSLFSYSSSNAKNYEHNTSPHSVARNNKVFKRHNLTYVNNC